ETVVPSSPLISSGLLYVPLAGSVLTGAVFANPNNQTVTVSYFFTDATGTDSAGASFVIAANSQVINFFNQPPFTGAPSAGTFTFNSSAPISVIGSQLFINERGDFLFTTLPAAPLPSSTSGTVIVPFWLDGGGYSDRVVLTNLTDQTITGSAQFLDATGAAATLTINSVTANSFPY